MQDSSGAMAKKAIYLACVGLEALSTFAESANLHLHVMLN